MAQTTHIQWCDSTVNPTGGCDGCELQQKCYADGIVKRFGPSNPGLPDVFTNLETYPGRMAEAAAWSDLAGTARNNKPWLSGMPRVIFVSDMSDALCDGFSFAYLSREIIATVSNLMGMLHQWPWLTKRPARMAEFSVWLDEQGIAWPTNLWAGTSITSQATTARIDSLLQVGTVDTVHFVSVEPAWEPIDLGPWLPRLNLVIHGGESGAGAEPFDVQWARGLRDQCHRFDVPYFLKQLGTCPVENGQAMDLDDYKGGDWNEWEADLRVREMPVVRSQSRGEGGNA